MSASALLTAKVLSALITRENLIYDNHNPNAYKLIYSLISEC